MTHCLLSLIDIKGVRTYVLTPFLLCAFLFYPSTHSVKVLEALLVMSCLVVFIEFDNRLDRWTYKVQDKLNARVKITLLFFFFFG